MLLSTTYNNSKDLFYTQSNFKNLADRFQSLAFATKEGIWEYDIETNTSFYNEGIIDMWGYTEEEMKDNNSWWRSNIHPQDKSRVITELDNLMSGDKSIWWGKYLFKHKNGTYKAILDRLFIVRNDDGKPLRMIGTMQDLTPINEIEKELESIRLEERKAMQISLLNAIEKEKKYLSEELHENINQMLAAININLGSIKKYVTPDRVESINAAQEVLIASISGIREISNSLSPVVLETMGLHHAITKLITHIFQGDKINFSVNVDEAINNQKDTGKFIALYRIAQAQLTNIKKHSVAENAFVNIVLFNDKIRMTIYDDGDGINLKQIKYGVGFSTIQNFVDAFGGSFFIKTLRGEAGFMLSVTI
jgi:PAS domain S-box-containing protein